jgi:hypothetical protein
LRIATSAAERAGASVRTLKLPEIVAEAWRIHPTVQEFEAHQALAWEYRTHHDAMPPLLRARLDESAGTTPAAYDEARGIANRARRALMKVFDEVDVILTFSAPGAAPKGLASTGDARFNRLWTLMGVPCVNIPAHVAEGGLPVGGADHRPIWRRRRRAQRRTLRRGCALRGEQLNYFCHSGMRLLAQARNPYSLRELWIPGSRGACHRAALCADPLARPGMTIVEERASPYFSQIRPSVPFRQ